MTETEGGESCETERITGGLERGASLQTERRSASELSLSLPSALTPTYPLSSSRSQCEDFSHSWSSHKPLEDQLPACVGEEQGEQGRQKYHHRRGQLPVQGRGETINQSKEKRKKINATMRLQILISCPLK